MATCTPPESTTSTVIAVRDSAGVEIIENAAPAWSPEEVWSVSQEPIVEIRAYDGGPAEAPLDPTSIHTDSQGRILVADGDQSGWEAVLVYDSNGAFIQKIGGPGEGPGEFGQVWWASAYRGDSLAVFDMARDKVVIFSPHGEFIRDVRIPALQTDQGPRGAPGFASYAEAVFADGSLLVYPRGALDVSDGPGAAWYRHLGLRLAPTGERWDTLGDFRVGLRYWDGERASQILFSPSVLVVPRSDEILVGEGESFEIRVLNPSGRMRRIMRRAFIPRPVTRADRDRYEEWVLGRVGASPEGGEAVLERMRQTIAEARVAETLPAYSAMLVDDLDHIWVEEFRWITPTNRPPDPTQAVWSIFDPSGRWLGQVEVPPELIVDAVVRDRVYGFVEDEFGVRGISVHELLRPG